MNRELAAQVAIQARVTALFLRHLELPDHDETLAANCPRCLLTAARFTANRAAISAARMDELAELEQHGPAEITITEGILHGRPTLGAHRRDRPQREPGG